MVPIFRAAEWSAAWAARIGVFCALLAGLVTCADVVIRHAGGQGILGTVDITQLMIMATAFLTIPYGFIADSHVAVDLGIERLPYRLQVFCRLLAALCGALLMLAIAGFGWQQFDTVALMGDKSQTIALPMTWYWYPLLGGAAFAVLMALVVALRHLVTLLTGDDPLSAAKQDGAT
ncbi:MAG: TRAP transporter small permease [Ferrovibrio sp.]|uniref:TRAP transporter small permease n=1 Tax=Ferrovibrio sp. TaxID=1917215 RepID=UPI00391DF077